MGLKGWKVPKIWKGSSCFIIGGGPSWLHQFNIPKELILQVRQKKKPMSCYSSYLRYLHDKHVIGVNGAGKTTFFKVIMGLIQPDSGRIILENNSRIGLLPQVINDEVPSLNINVFDFIEVS